MDGDLCPACSPEGAAADRGLSILLVDDDPFLRDLLARGLSRRGYRVLAAASASEALGLVAGDSPGVDVVLTDIVMPGMGGFELLGALGELHPRLPVVLMTGSSAHREAALQGPNGALLKPFALDDLEARIRALCPAA